MPDAYEPVAWNDLARVCWNSLNLPGPQRIPTPVDLATGLGMPHMTEAFEEYGRRFRMLGAMTRGRLTLRQQSESHDKLDLPPFAVGRDDGETEALHTLHSLMRGGLALKPEDQTEGVVKALVHGLLIVFDLAEEDDGPHPIAPLMKAWMRKPQYTLPGQHPGKRIIPARLAMGRESDRRAPRHFSPSAHASQPEEDGSQAILPGFEFQDVPSVSLPLELYDMGRGPDEGHGRGAPLPLRIFFESIFAVPQNLRNGFPVALEAVTLREFLSWLYPGQRPRPARYWPLLMRAIQTLDNTRIPVYDTRTGRHSLRRVVSVGDIPRGRYALDDAIRIIVDLPAGSEKGPQVSRNLRWWGIRDAVAYRLLLGLPYQWYSPGVTLRPVGKNRYWVQSQDPQHYPLIDDDLLIRLAFPRSTTSQWRRLRFEARRALKILYEEGEVQILDGKILPPKPGG